MRPKCDDFVRSQFETTAANHEHVSSTGNPVGPERSKNPHTHFLHGKVEAPRHTQYPVAARHLSLGHGVNEFR